MKIIQTTLFLIAFSITQSHARPHGVTHMMASPYTIPKGMLVYGSSFQFGLLDNFQVGTNLFAILQDVPNAQVKMAIWENKNFAIAATGFWNKYNLEDVRGQRLAEVTSYGPGLATAFTLSPQLSLFNGGVLMIRDVEGVEKNIQKSGLNQGSFWQTEIGHLYQVERAIAAGVSYDFTFDLLGFGMSHHWPNFQVGFHYYPKADNDRAIPILAGGGTFTF